MPINFHMKKIIKKYRGRSLNTLSKNILIGCAHQKPWFSSSFLSMKKLIVKPVIQKNTSHYRSAWKTNKKKFDLNISATTSRF